MRIQGLSRNTVRAGLALVLVGSLAGCFQNDAQRGVAGAVVGGALAGATGNNVATGALVGGAAGVFCSQTGTAACQNN